MTRQAVSPVSVALNLFWERPRPWPVFEDYARKYQSIRMERRNSILQLTFHTNDGPLRWGRCRIGNFLKPFATWAATRNKVVIMTGTGEAFSGLAPHRTPGLKNGTGVGQDVLGRQAPPVSVDMEVPMISAINGPALRHSEIPLLCDIVLASEDTSFRTRPILPMDWSGRRRSPRLSFAPGRQSWPLFSC